MRNNKWFSVVIAIMITAFLIVISSWILILVIQESKNTKLVYNSISTQAWAEWTIEYALLKVKNHSDWFADKIDFKQDVDANILAYNINKITNKDVVTSYEITNNSKSYSWIIASWEFEIIPLYIDNWELITNNSKNPNKNSSSLSKVLTFKFSWDNDYVRNIIWNDMSWTTFWMVWTWSNNLSVWAWFSVNYDSGNMKSIDNDSLVLDDSKTIKLENIKIEDFLTRYENNYLIIYNVSQDWLSYSLESNELFSLPKLKITASSKILNYKKNLEFSENKSKYMDMLKYSIFNK